MSEEKPFEYVGNFVNSGRADKLLKKYLTTQPKLLFKPSANDALSLDPAFRDFIEGELHKPEICNDFCVANFWQGFSGSWLTQQELVTQFVNKEKGMSLPVVLGEEPSSIGNAKILAFVRRFLLHYFTMNFRFFLGNHLYADSHVLVYQDLPAFLKGHFTFIKDVNGKFTYKGFDKAYATTTILYNI